MTGDERKQMLAAIFDSITASAEGMDRLERLRGLTSLHRRCDPEAGQAGNGAEDGTRTRYPQPHSVRTLRVSSGGLDLVRRAA